MKELFLSDFVKRKIKMMNVNNIIYSAVKRIKREPKITREELRYNERRAESLFNGKGLFENWR